MRSHWSGMCSVGQQCPTLCDPMAPLSMEYSRQEYCSAFPFSPSQGPSQPRDRTCISCVSCPAFRSFACWAIGEAYSRDWKSRVLDTPTETERHREDASWRHTKMQGEDTLTLQRQRLQSCLEANEPKGCWQILDTNRCKETLPYQLYREPTPWFFISRLQNYGKINFCCSSQTECYTLPQQP